MVHSTVDKFSACAHIKKGRNPSIFYGVNLIEMSRVSIGLGNFVGQLNEARNKYA